MNANALPAVPLDAELQQAITEHQAGRYAEAEELYLAILQVQPYHAIANHNMGLLAGQVGQYQAGLPYLHKALSVNPDEGQFWLSYADGLLKAGEREQALEIVTAAITRGLDNEQSQGLRNRIETAIASTPTAQETQHVIALYQAGHHAELEVASHALTQRYPESDFAWSVLGTALQLQGKDAFEALQKTAQLAPNDAEAHGNLGTAWQERGMYEQAVDSYTRALELNPDFVEAHGNLAAALQAQGKLEQAEQAYRQALALRPDYAKSHFNLGNTLHAMQRSADAIACYQRALALLPGDAEIYLNLGNAQQDLQQWQPAIVSYRAVLQLAPHTTAAHANLAAALHGAEDYSGAVASYRRAIELHADDAKLHNNLGRALQSLDQAEEAIAAYEQAIALDGSFAQALSNLGLLQCKQENYTAAIEYCARVLRLQPDDAQACGQLAIAYGAAQDRDNALKYFQQAIDLVPGSAANHRQLADYYSTIKRYPLAVEAYRRTLEIDFGDSETHNHLGVALQELGQYEEATAAYACALELEPKNTSALCNLGSTQQAQKLLEQAKQTYLDALAIDDKFERAHFALGNCYVMMSEPLRALECYHQSLALKPDYRDAYVNISATLSNIGRIDEAIETCRKGLAICPLWETLFSNYLFLLSHSASIDAETLFAEHRRFSDTFETHIAKGRVGHSNTRDPLRTLKVGFVSGDLHNHPIPHFIIPILENIVDGAQLSLYAYHNNAQNDDVTLRLREFIPHWRQVEHLSDPDLAQLIRDDGIDILIDLSGHTGKNRLLMFAAKPAPIQASWIGYPLTTGLQAVDYYLSDPFFSPAGLLDSQFSEKLLLLPACVPFLPSEYAPAVQPAPALTNGYITFGSFNRLNKINRQVIARWSRLLRALPDTRMLIAAMPKTEAPEQLRAWFKEEGIAPERLTFEGRTGMTQFMAMHHRVDICLDTFPYGGGTTTFHALWMGVPTLTVAGPTFPSRAGTMILRQIELEEFIASDDDDFVRKGVAMAANPMLLGAYRFSMRHRLERSTMGKPKLITEGLENGLRMAWQRWCEGLPPISFEAPVAVPNPPIGL
ncbi:tetratricopeptide repeat protein [Janthinobacterium lividum]|uniref:protein O-GlcNAc transferase n=1 Tax=Janthinobacterium lividum TaxID=29581 RepID=A0ABU0Y1P2_9BURK|nr:tetratricopeptide repeat protein [Janthinobacterium lividum]MDQ4629263.1 tetratricopeptide repeat protein [Janthinobacterium lividum]MDQ4676336.1 tetratricopeptide repeat protein [Janthinobacterium lividum]MDQ4688740.1 tetratricopeptide repeat protein [Janthinobacterium lividum]